MPTKKRKRNESEKSERIEHMQALAGLCSLLEEENVHETQIDSAASEDFIATFPEEDLQQIVDDIEELYWLDNPVVKEEYKRQLKLKEEDNDDFEEEESENIGFDDNEKVHPESSLTVRECNLLFVKYIVAHQSTCKAFNFVLRMIKAIIPSAKIPSSFGNLLDKISSRFKQILFQKCYVCCGEYSFQPKCTKCGKIAKRPTLFVRKLSEVLKYKESTSYAKKMEYGRRLDESSKDYREDIYGYDAYSSAKKRIFKAGVCGSTSLDWIDGVKISKHSLRTITPVAHVINELKGTERFKPQNILLEALWCAHTPVDYRILGNVLIDDWKLLREGFPISHKGQECTVKHEVIGNIFDHKCASKFYGFKEQHCSSCKHPGKTIDRVRCFAANTFPARTWSETNIAYPLLRSSPREKGYNIYKSVSPFVEQYSSIQTSYCHDSLHSFYHGPERRYIEYHINSKFRLEPWYIKRDKQKEIDFLTSQIRLPKGYKKIPSLTKLGTWTAEEVRNFLHFASPFVLQSYISKTDCKALLALLNVVELSERSGTNPSDLQFYSFQALSMLSSFFGEKFVTIKGHYLMHKDVDYRRFGPSWTHSAFPMETYGGYLLKYKLSSSNFEESLCKLVVINEEMEELEKDIKSDIGKNLLKLFKKPTSKKRWYSIDKNIHYCKVNREIVKLSYHNVEYYTRDYSYNFNFDNSGVCFKNSDGKEIVGQITKFSMNPELQIQVEKENKEKFTITPNQIISQAIIVQFRYPNGKEEKHFVKPFTIYNDSIK